MSLNKTKCDSDLGWKVNQHLLQKGLETPMKTEGKKLSPKQKIAKIEKHFQQIMTIMGLDLNDDSLMDTPTRVSKMFISEVFWGLDYENFPKITTVDNKMKYDQLLIERNIQVKSFCEHHLMPINGVAHIAYMPSMSNGVLGLSKMPRIVEFFSRRPQVQERLTQQIGEALSFILNTDSVAVIIAAEHDCVKMRGVEDPCCDTITSFMGGKFRDDASLKQEFLMSLGLKSDVY